MDICKLILDVINKKGEVKTSEIVKKTGFSRAYINRFFQKLRDEGKIVLIGKANKALYIPATQNTVNKAKKNILRINRILHNIDLSEDVVLDDIKKQTGIFQDVTHNVSTVLSYAFLEMLNNAIEHSQSEFVEVSMEKDKNTIHFKVIDKGIGIYNNIMQKNHLNNVMESIQDLLKGKQTTAPKTHSGEGIFFTSKVVDMLIIQSSEKKIIFNNLLEDIFIKDIRKTIGTKVICSIGLDTKKELNTVFKQYTGKNFDFDKTKVSIKLYEKGTEYISRSQARRILSGLDKFKKIILNFQGVEVIGQGFADEIFRVWKLRYPEINIIAQNTNKNVQFMINRALAALR